MTFRRRSRSLAPATPCAATSAADWSARCSTAKGSSAAWRITAVRSGPRPCWWSARAGRLRQNYPHLKVSSGSNDPAGFDVVVNATPLGMKAGDPMPLDVSRLSPSTYVAEVVMKQEKTAFPATTASELREVAQIDY